MSNFVEAKLNLIQVSTFAFYQIENFVRKKK